MSAQSTGLSKSEKKARRRSRGSDRARPALDDSGRAQPTLDQLLYSRKQARQLLGNVSIATLQRLEAQGVLRPKRLDKSKRGQGQVFYTGDNLREIVEGDDAAR